MLAVTHCVSYSYRFAKKKYRVDCDLLAIYGGDIARIKQRDYAFFVALWLNRSRATAQSALHIRKGMHSVLAPMFGGEMDEQWYADISDTPDQAVMIRDSERVAQNQAATT